MALKFMMLGPLVAMPLVLASAALAIQETPSESDSPPPPSPSETGSDTFVETWSDIQSNRAQAIQSIGKAPQLQAMRAQVRNVIRKSPSDFVNATRRNVIPELYQNEIAQFLVSVGYGPGDLPKAKGDAASIILAAENAVTGSASFADKQILSQMVVRAKPVSITPDTSLGDGFNSTIEFRVLESYKGSSAPDETFKIRQFSDRPPETPLQINTEQEFVLFLSSENYKFSAFKQRGRPSSASQFLGETFAPYLVQNGQMFPLGEGRPVPLSSIDRGTS